MKPVKLSLTQLKRFMTLMHLQGDTDNTNMKLVINDEIIVDLLDNECVDKVNGSLVINEKGINEIKRLSKISGLART
tara:strand:+ start:337 stop:567 length:231 start_codon:yes stop_codon:yes gene_type:complete